ncbi:LuxR family transcriptional regulator [Leucobacter viscericola]|uniref:LuxR family transcriptional regulator n=1 Tax=Leucobacter viscericola TaxID=2714935 RepID=A0A6G7XH19_9MICO|nr:LuxR C-terminal-related transcriptional regulator [Leucobacter viscericola]QIK63900.1 LuxR family transcriptional regulator [Leucobacter viscericola]
MFDKRNELEGATMRQETFFVSEIEKAMVAINQRLSVHISTLGEGRQVVFARVVSLLEGEGRRVYRIRCSKGLSGEPLAALRLSDFWGESRLDETTSVSRIVSTFAAAIFKNRLPIIAIENVEHVDPLTWAVIEAIEMRTRVQLVTCGDRMTSSRIQEKNGLADFAWPWKEIPIGGLSFVEVSAYVAREVGEGVEPELIRRVYMETRGHFDLVKAVVQTGLSEGFIVLRGGEWVLDGEMWSSLTEQYLWFFLDRLPKEMLEMLEVLAVCGGAKLEDIGGTFSETLLRQLVEEGIVTSTDPDKKTPTQTIPPILDRYFEETMTLARRKEIFQGCDHPKAEYLNFRETNIQDAPKVASWPTSHPALERTRAADVALAGMLRAKWRTSYERTRADWLERPSAETALLYLRALFVWEGNPGAVAEVFRDLGSTEGESDAAAEIEVLRLSYRYLVESEHGDAVVVQEGLDKRFPRFSDVFFGSELFLRGMLALPYEENDLTRDTSNFFYLRSLIYVRALKGSVSEHLDEILPETMAASRDPQFPRQRDTATYLSIAAGMFADGRIVELTGWSLDLIEAAMEEPDYRFVIQHSYNAALGLYLMGRLEEAASLADAVFANGDPALFSRYFYAGLLLLSALIAYRQGRETVVRRFLEHYHAMGVSDAALPCLAPEIATALQQLIDQKPGKATATLLAGIARTVAQGSVLAAFFLTVVSIQLCGKRVVSQLEAFDLGSRVSPKLSLFLQFTQALLKGDPEQLVSAGAALAAEGEDYFASIAYGLAIDSLARSGELKEAKTVAELRDSLSIAAAHEPLKLVAATLDLRPSPRLTPRELELAAHANLSNQEIANRFSLSPRTVENHLQHAREKLNVPDRRSLAAAATALQESNRGRTARGIIGG